MDTLIVTGGAGFIGSNFVRLALNETRRQVVVLDKLTYAGNLCSLDELARHSRFVFERADISDQSAMERVFSCYQPSALVNLAAETHVDRSIENPRPFIETNIVGTYVLLETTRKYLKTRSTRKQTRFRFLQVSTDEVYGTLGPAGRFSEATPYVPNSPYAASKASADHLMRAYFSTFGVPTLVTNCSNNYGPFQFPEKLIPLMILNAIEGMSLPIYGDGGNIRDWLYVEDHCRGIMAVLKKGKPGEKYNIGAGNERTNLQIVDGICRCLDKVLPPSENPAMQKQGLSSYKQLKTLVPDRPGHDRRYAIDASKIRKELAWKPRCDLETGLARTVCWYIENRSWCKQVQEGKYKRERLGLDFEPH
ncbi:MAG TPA: dTDP-glucose 4,6-dehydratase [Terriglobia bacterium]|nr:dTDP-glucose 4,6-dehydratase [Terriglobia bacterium]